MKNYFKNMRNYGLKTNIFIEIYQYLLNKIFNVLVIHYIIYFIIYIFIIIILFII